MGKVHGSLARAGKVKSQTPKVRVPQMLLCCYCVAEREHGENKNSRRPSGEEADVEPQEKKKVPKGRAKKRIQYTRRFVNVTMTGGKRKMNPNPTS
ncbi:ribosomal protein S30 [Sphaerulina musiva SO2202]|uniref:Ribosomal protein S30 n=1 Tax=Sphaerulina musiva (strain SO2202) TaxID=692275 RepID=N1QMX2_SPHMS|nr:ribosomal protein S30 [Sphaerulina musiva SO2202]EMF16909.1 ribosomal protein S30 [Sphaerulina musiva SO2202]